MNVRRVGKPKASVALSRPDPLAFVELPPFAADVAPTDSKTLEMWPMPTAASYSPPETDEGDEGDEELIPVATHSPRVRLPAKYFDPHTGSTWSGRGVMPVWLKAALHGGKKLEDFLAAVATA